MDNENQGQGAQFGPAAAPQEPKSHIGLVITVVAVLIVAGLAMFYLYGLTMTRSGQNGQAAQEKPEVAANQSASAELDAIEQGLQAMDVENSDKELDMIDKEYKKR